MAAADPARPSRPVPHSLTPQHLRRGFMFRLALGASAGPAGLDAADADLNLEFGGMVGARTHYLCIDGCVEAAPVRPFLQLRLRVPQRPVHRFEPRAPVTLDDGACRREPSVAVD